MLAIVMPMLDLEMAVPFFMSSLNFPDSIPRI